jgi:hypothetical protein
MQQLLEQTLPELALAVGSASNAPGANGTWYAAYGRTDTANRHPASIKCNATAA